jgi:hypothetical protein
MARFWPPAKSCGLSVLWSLIFGFLFQLALPLVLAMLGAKHAALRAMLPGFWPILWSTGGWFASIAPAGYVMMYSINTIFYAMILLAAFRSCAFLKRKHA